MSDTDTHASAARSLDRRRKGEFGEMDEASTLRIAPDVKLGRNVKLYAFVNLYGCEIGDDSKIGTFVEIGHGVRIGSRVKISSHTFICEGVTIEDEVFVGHGVMFINDRYPRATNASGALQSEADWLCTPTLVKRDRKSVV